MEKHFSRREAMKTIGLTIGDTAVGTQVLSQVGANQNDRPTLPIANPTPTPAGDAKVIGAWNEWGRLREVG